MQAMQPTIAIHRIYDIADEIVLEKVGGLRQRLERTRSGAVNFANPPLAIDLGSRQVAGYEGRLIARLYAFGTISLIWRVKLAERLPWEQLAQESLVIPQLGGLGDFFEAEYRALKGTLASALVNRNPDQAGRKDESEQVMIIQVRGVDGAASPPAVLDDDQTLTMLLGDRERYSPGVRDDLRRYMFSYTADDLAILAFDRVLVVDPAGIYDVADMVELAHVVLVELRYYNHLLQRQLRAAWESLATPRAFKFWRYSRVRRMLMELHAEITEVRQRLHAALDITEDLFYARIYRTAMELYGASELSRVLEDKLRVLLDVYGMLSEEINSSLNHLLELTIIALIAVEIVMALWP